MKRNLVLENRFYDLGPVVKPRGDNEAYGFKIYEHRPSKNIVIPAQAGIYCTPARGPNYFIYPCGVPLCQGFVVQAMDTRRCGCDEREKVGMMCVACKIFIYKQIFFEKKSPNGDWFINYPKCILILAYRRACVP